MSDAYPSRYPGNAHKGYKRVLLQNRKIADAWDDNEQAQLLHAQDAGIGNESFGTISARSGCAISVNKAAGTVTVTDGVVWCGGYLHELAEATLPISTSGTVLVGVAVSISEVTYIDDPELLGQEENTVCYGRETAGREKQTAVWATDGDPFYALFTIVDGALLNDVEAPESESMEALVERHVVEDHGDHQIEGLKVRPVKAEAGKLYYSISTGLARSAGKRIKKSTDTSFSYDEEPVEQTINGEAHIYNGSAGDVVSITLNNAPIAQVDVLTIDKQVTETVTHGIAGGADALANSPVVSIQSITQGGTTYVVGVDYQLADDLIDWSLGGAEPAPSSTFQVQYVYTDTVNPLSVGRSEITLTGGYNGASVRVNYRYYLPRIDIIALDSEGYFRLLKGVPSKYNVKAPRVAIGLTPLVRIHNNWGILPTIEEIDQISMHEWQVRAIYRLVLAQASAISQLQLQQQADAKLTAAQKAAQTAWFWDNFTDETQRDAGLLNDAAVYDGLCQLPISMTRKTIKLNAPLLLGYESEVIIENLWRTATREINKYDVFGALPGVAVLDPSVDEWTQVETDYSPTVYTSLFTQTGISRTSTTTELISSETVAAEYLRPIVVNYSLSHFGVGEELQSITFDGIGIALPAVTTFDANGQLSGSFSIPGNIPAGTKDVLFQGSAVSAVATFVGSGEVTTETYQMVVTSITRIVQQVENHSGDHDPIGQSFSMSRNRVLLGFSVEFTARGNASNHVIGVLREAEYDLPVGDALAEGVINGDFVVSETGEGSEQIWTRIDFKAPAPVLSGGGYAVCTLTSDPLHAVAIAELGDSEADKDNPNAKGFDARQQAFMPSNALGGQAVESPNNNGYSLIHDTDMTLQVHAARFTETERRVVIAPALVLDAVSDLRVNCTIYDFGIETNVVCELVRASGEVIQFEPNSHLMLDEYVSETVELALVLAGTEFVSPIVYPTIQILLGTLATTATYTSQAVDVDVTNSEADVRLVVETLTPGDSAISVSLENGASFVAPSGEYTDQLGDGWYERGYILQNFSQFESRARLTLSGAPDKRPYGRALRVRATEKVA